MKNLELPEFTYLVVAENGQIISSKFIGYSEMPGVDTKIEETLSKFRGLPNYGQLTFIFIPERGSSLCDVYSNDGGEKLSYDKLTKIPIYNNLDEHLNNADNAIFSRKEYSGQSLKEEFGFNDIFWCCKMLSFNIKPGQNLTSEDVSSLIEQTVESLDLSEVSETAIKQLNMYLFGKYYPIAIS